MMFDSLRWTFFLVLEVHNSRRLKPDNDDFTFALSLSCSFRLCHEMTTISKWWWWWWWRWAKHVCLLQFSINKKIMCNDWRNGRRTYWLATLRPQITSKSDLIDNWKFQYAIAAAVITNIKTYIRVLFMWFIAL